MPLYRKFELNLQCHMESVFIHPLLFYNFVYGIVERHKVIVVKLNEYFILGIFIILVAMFIANFLQSYKRRNYFKSCKHVFSL